ncbi:MAG: acylphosphatase [Candidatus Pacearchaeota archaeon]
MKKANRMIIQGTVQGVFFRQFVKDNADKMGLRGFVRNLPEGNVEIIVEGEGETIERFLNIMKKGPEHAQIRNVIIEERKWSGDFNEFKILRF